MFTINRSFTITADEAKAIAAVVDRAGWPTRPDLEAFIDNAVRDAIDDATATADVDDDTEDEHPRCDSCGLDRALRRTSSGRWQCHECGTVPDSWDMVLDFDLESSGPGNIENRLRLYWLSGGDGDGWMVAWVQVDQGEPGVWWIEDSSGFASGLFKEARDEWWNQVQAATQHLLAAPVVADPSDMVRAGVLTDVTDERGTT